VASRFSRDINSWGVELRAHPRDQARIDELADKCNEGALTEAERDEYDDYLQAIRLIGIARRKARCVLPNDVFPRFPHALIAQKTDSAVRTRLPMLTAY
jgi:hypothetical protein